MIGLCNISFAYDNNQLSPIIFVGAEKLKIQTKPSDLHVFMEDSCEICADEDLIEEIINSQLLMLSKKFEQSNKQPESTVGVKSFKGL